MKKRLMLLACMLCLLASFCTAAHGESYTVPIGTLSTKLTYLKSVFPQGWYWNHWSEDELGSSYTMQSFTINGNATTISTKPCDASSDLHANVSDSTCNHYWGSWKGVQCTGFARMMFELVWDMDTETESYGMYYHPDTDNIDVLDYVKPGDMVWTGGHMFLVTAVSGDTFTVVHCNKSGKCDIRWGDTYTKTWVHSKMKANGTGYVASPTPIVYGSDITSWARYQVVTSTLNVRKWASKSVDKSATLQEGDYFYVDLNHTITKSGTLYGYCRTADGKYGWVQYANTSYAVPVEDCTHSNTEGSVTKEPTCTEEGVFTTVCSDCGEAIATSAIDPEHGLLTQTTTAPTCTEDSMQITVCNDCGAVLESIFIEAALGHTWGDPVVTKAATCIEQGEKTTYCTVCGEMVDKYATHTVGHTDGEWIVTKKPTCYADGEEVQTCAVCGEVIATIIIFATDHLNGEWVTTLEATCTVDGEMLKKCVVCGATMGADNIPATGHTEGEWGVITEATETSDGLKRLSCTVCCETLSEKAIPATGDDNPLSGITMSAGQNLSAIPGETVTVPISISNPDSVALGSITLYYTLPEGVSIVSASTCGAAANASITYNEAFAFASDINDGISGSGQLLSLTFSVAADASFPLTFSLKPEIVAADLSADATPASISITIVEGSRRTPGDVNEDGKVNSRDALAIIKYAAGQSMSINTANADVNADGKINSRDALAIIKYAAGQDVVLK